MATRKFHHVGLTTHDVQPDEDEVAPSKCWVTNPNNHPYRIEFLRYAPDSPVSREFQNAPHIAYETDDLEGSLTGKEIVIPPFDPEQGDSFARVAFTMEDGLFVEYMQFKPGRTWFGGK